MFQIRPKLFCRDRQRRPFAPVLASILLFFVVCALFFGGLDRISRRALAEQKQSLTDALWTGVTQYYAAEGRYPETLEILQEEYGIQYDTDHFFVDYQIAGSNILPDITVIERSQAKE